MVAISSKSKIYRKGTIVAPALLFLISILIFVMSPYEFMSIFHTNGSNISQEASRSETKTKRLRHKSSLEKWTSPHMIDCHTISMDDTDDGGMYAMTKTNPPFLMNIHNPNVDRFVSNQIKNNGCWECKHVQDMVDTLNANPGSYFLDIGGNIGMWTLAAVAANKQAFTIEPSYENFSRICKTVNRNNFHDRVRLMTIAATSKPKLFRLDIPDLNQGGTHVIEIQADKVPRTDDKSIIKGYPIDSLDLPVDHPVVLKIDVEGHELEALSGAMEFLEKANIVYIMIELRLDFYENTDWNKFFQIFSSKGLVPFRCDQGEKLTRVDPDPTKLPRWKANHVGYMDVIWKKLDTN